MKMPMLIVAPVCLLIVGGIVVSQSSKMLNPGKNTDDLEWDMEMQQANRLMDAGEFQAAYDQGQQMVTLCNRKQLDTRSLAASKAVMGNAARNLNRLPESEALNREALQLRESVLPPTHFRVLQSVVDLASTLFWEGNFDKAEPLYNRAIEGLNRMTDRDGPSECLLGKAHSDLGGMYIVRNNYAKAEEFLTKAQISWEQVGIGCGEMHELFGRLAMVYVQNNRRDKAEGLLEKTVAEFLPEQGEEPDQHFATYSEGLATFYYADKRYAD